MARRSIVSALLVLTLLGCGGSKLDPAVARQVSVAKASKDPAYWLGPRYDGLKLIYVESGSESFFASSLYYADCSDFEMESLSPHCHRVVEIDNDVPIAGEISTMGGCIFSTSINGVTVATFPVNPEDLRVFAQGATILVSARSRTESLKAIAALKPLNNRPLRSRDVSSALGSCKAPQPKPQARLSAKQRYEQTMKQSFFIDSIGAINLNAVDPSAAKPKVFLDEFLANIEIEPALLRNEAYRIERIQPLADVRAPHARLAEELRAYAAVLDGVMAAARRDGLDKDAWTADRRTLKPKMSAARARIVRTVRVMQARGYSIFERPSD